MASLQWLNGVVVPAPVEAFNNVKLAISIVGPLVAAYIGTLLGLRKFRSEEAFKRQTVWLKELNGCCALLQDATAPVLHGRFSNQEPGARAAGLERERGNIASRIFQIRDCLAEALLYSDGDLYSKCHVLYDLVAEYETSMTDPVSALRRVTTAAQAVAESAAVQFRKKHGWAALDVDGDECRSQLQTVKEISASEIRRYDARDGKTGVPQLPADGRGLGIGRRLFGSDIRSGAGWR